MYRVHSIYGRDLVSVPSKTGLYCGTEGGYSSIDYRVLGYLSCLFMFVNGEQLVATARDILPPF